MAFATFSPIGVYTFVRWTKFLWFSIGLVHFPERLSTDLPCHLCILSCFPIRSSFLFKLWPVLYPREAVFSVKPTLLPSNPCHPMCWSVPHFCNLQYMSRLWIDQVSFYKCSCCWQLLSTCSSTRCATHHVFYVSRSVHLFNSLNLEPIWLFVLFLSHFPVPFFPCLSAYIPLLYLLFFEFYQSIQLARKCAHNTGRDWTETLRNERRKLGEFNLSKSPQKPSSVIVDVLVKRFYSILNPLSVIRIWYF